MQVEIYDCWSDEFIKNLDIEHPHLLKVNDLIEDYPITNIYTDMSPSSYKIYFWIKTREQPKIKGKW